jgi:hypothetical protein
MRRITALLLIATLVAPGCATTRASRMQTVPRTAAPAASDVIVADYARQLPVGTGVRVGLEHNKTMRGTLIKVTDQNLVIQPKGRVAQPIVEVPLRDVVSLEREQPSSGGLGRAIAAGAAVGAGAALGVFFILIAIYSD